MCFSEIDDITIRYELKNQKKFEKFEYRYVYYTEKFTHLIFNAVNINASKVYGFIKLSRINQN